MSSILELEPHPDYPEEYLVCRRTGVHYYRLAKERKYEDSYFQEEYKSQYKKTYYEDEAQLRKLANIRLDMMASYQKPEGRTLFEVGCAAGYFLSEAAKRGYRVEGIELSPTEAEYANRTLGLNVRTGSFLDDSILPKERFDAVCAFFVIEHFPDTEAVFRKITDLVKPGGVLFFGLPSLNGPSFQTDPQEWFRTHPSDHFWDYSPSSLEKMLKMFGFDTVCKRPMSYHPKRDRGWKGKYLTQNLFVRYANLSCYADTFHSIAIKKI